MKTELELKDIACYFPYKLKCRIDQCASAEICFIDLNDMIGVDTWDGIDRNLDYCDIAHIKPILRPLSDLYKPCIDGKAPLLELAKMAFKKDEDFRLRGDKVELLSGGISRYEFYFSADDTSFRAKYLSSLTFCGEFRLIPNQYKLFQYLFEHHFDVNKLIPAGLAIDCNTLENNPYK
jgi:hypothetical protein